VLADTRMHEAAIARRLVAEALQRMEAAGGDRVATVEAVLGSTGQLSLESVRQHFELAARGTPAERAMLRVTWAPARYCCFDCMYEFASRTPGGGCPRCGGTALNLDREDLAYVRSVSTEAS
jgi:hydrogenase nickel incorporation protein HypA/HybF